MITLQELCTFLDLFLKVKEIKDYCPNGLQVEGNKHVKKIAVAVSASLKTIEAAVEWGADVLLVHHGIFWNGDSFAIDGVKRQKIKTLLDHGISLLAYHLPLDFHTEVGNNWEAARQMGWEQLTSFDAANGVKGVMGKFPPMSVDAFQKQLEKFYDHPAYTALGGNKTTVSSAALISGGAHRYISDIKCLQVDCFITGSFDEPVWHIAHEEGICFFALGHSATEKIGVQTLGKYLEEKFSLKVQFLEIPNPF